MAEQRKSEFLKAETIKFCVKWVDSVKISLTFI